MSHNFQIIASATRQWQHLNGTWNPTDPARFVQPDAFDNNRDLSQQLFGNGDDNTLNGGGRESGAAYRPFSVRIGGQWLAPWGISVGGSYVIQAGGYVGPLLTRLDGHRPAGDAVRAVHGPPGQRHDAAQPAGDAPALHGADPQRRPDPQRRRQVPAAEDRPHVPVRTRSRSSRRSTSSTRSTPAANTQWNTGANQTYSPNYRPVQPAPAAVAAALGGVQVLEHGGPGPGARVAGSRDSDTRERDAPGRVSPALRGRRRPVDRRRAACHAATLRGAVSGVSRARSAPPISAVGPPPGSRHGTDASRGAGGLAVARLLVVAGGRRRRMFEGATSRSRRRGRRGPTSCSSRSTRRARIGWAATATPARRRRRSIGWPPPACGSRRRCRRRR